MKCMMLFGAEVYQIGAAIVQGVSVAVVRDHSFGRVGDESVHVNM